jgi:hypothetical protein
VKSGSSSVARRGLFFLLLAAAFLWVRHDLASPQSVIRRAWRSVTAHGTQVEGVKNDLYERMGVPR